MGNANTQTVLQHSKHTNNKSHPTDRIHENIAKTIKHATRKQNVLESSENIEKQENMQRELNNKHNQREHCEKAGRESTRVRIIKIAPKKSEREKMAGESAEIVRR